MAKRLSVTLEREDEATVASFARSGTAEHDAMLAWLHEGDTGADKIDSEAAVIRILVRAGAQALRARVLDLAYPQLAVLLTDEDRAEGRVARQRYADRTDRHIPE